MESHKNGSMAGNTIIKEEVNLIIYHHSKYN